MFYRLLDGELRSSLEESMPQIHPIFDKAVKDTLERIRQEAENEKATQSNGDSH